MLPFERNLIGISLVVFVIASLWVNGVFARHSAPPPQKHFVVRPLDYNLTPAGGMRQVPCAGESASGTTTCWAPSH